MLNFRQPLESDSFEYAKNDENRSKRTPEAAGRNSHGPNLEPQIMTVKERMKQESTNPPINKQLTSKLIKREAPPYSQNLTVKCGREDRIIK